MGEAADNNPEYELLMPFVVCRSQGGTYDDESFAAGWELATLEATLKLLSMTGVATYSVYVRPNSVPQADLIGMKNKWAVTIQGLDEDTGWVFVQFEKGN